MRNATWDSVQHPVSFFHPDHLGSTRLVTSMSGAVEQITSYHPFGATLSNGGTNVPYKFTGQELDETGLYDYHARLYDPVLGRFISADTVVPNPSNPQDLNRYSYVRNNPVRFTDASGHQIDLGGGDVIEVPPVHVCGNCIANYVPPGFAPYQFPVGITPDGGGTYVAVTQGPSLWNAYVRAVGKRIQALNSQGADPDYLNSEFKRYMGYDLFPANLTSSSASSLGLPPNHFINRGVNSALPATTTPASPGTISSLRNFALGLIPGYDLGQALGNPDAGLGDYFLGVLGVIPGGKGAQVGFQGIFGAVRHLLTPGSSKGIFTFHGGQEGLESLFLEVGQHGRLIDHPTFKGLFVDLGQGANVTMRDSAKYGPTMGVKIPGIDIDKIHLPK